MKSRKFILRFFLTYLCVLIPVMMLNLFSQQYILHQAERRADSSVRWQLEQTASEIAALKKRADDYTLNIACAEDLQRVRVLSDPRTERRAVDVLESVVLYDAQLSDIVVDFDSDYYYSYLGKTSKDVFLRESLRLDEISRSRAEALFARTDSGFTVLRTVYDTGWLCIHCPFNRLQHTPTPMSMNYLIPLTELAQPGTLLLSSRLSSLCLTADDGSAVSFRRDGNAVTLLPGDCDILSGQDRVTLAAEGLTVEAAYDYNEVYGDIRRSQLLGSVFLCVGMLFSALVSLFLSRRRWNRLRLVERLVSGQDADSEHRLDEFDGILAEFRSLRANQTHLEQSVTDYRRLLRRQTALMLFQGQMGDRAVLDGLLRECGISLNEEYFYIGCALCDAAPDDAIEAFMGDRLFCETTKGDAHLLLFLDELPNTDDSHALRQAAAEHLAGFFGAENAACPVIAASQVYQQLSMVHFAYAEAIELLETMQRTQSGWFDCCQPSVAAPDLLLQLDQAELTAFAESLARGDFADAEARFTELAGQIARSTDPDQNKTYLRACILQAALPAFKDSDREQAFRDAAAIDPEDGERFADAFAAVLRGCQEPAEDRVDIFPRVVQFVEEHYAENDLSYEMVAEYAGVTKTYLSRLFRANTSMSYIEYLSRIRLTRADELLRTTDIPLRDITHMVGYLDESSFRRKYRAYFGFSVSDVRREGTSRSEE